MGWTFLRKAFGNVEETSRNGRELDYMQFETLFLKPFHFCRNKTELSFSYLKYTGAVRRRAGLRSVNVEAEDIDVGCHFVGISYSNPRPMNFDKAQRRCSTHSIGSVVARAPWNGSRDARNHIKSQIFQQTPLGGQQTFQHRVYHPKSPSGASRLTPSKIYNGNAV